MSTCRSCGAPVMWAKHAVSGSMMPLDPAPADDGTVWITGRLASDVPVVRVESHGHHAPQDVPRYRSHFATCPNAKNWRKR